MTQLNNNGDARILEFSNRLNEKFQRTVTQLLVNENSGQ